MPKILVWMVLILTFFAEESALSYLHFHICTALVGVPRGFAKFSSEYWTNFELIRQIALDSTEIFYSIRWVIQKSLCILLRKLVSFDPSTSFSSKIEPKKVHLQRLKFVALPLLFWSSFVEPFAVSKTVNWSGGGGPHKSETFWHQLGLALVRSLPRWTALNSVLIWSVNESKHEL